MAKRWLSARIDIPPSMSGDDVLLDLVAPTTAALRQDGAVDRFFFLRHIEGGPHVRYRLRTTGMPGAVTDAVRNTVRDTLRHATAPPITWVRYVPETAKYGGEAGMDLSERHFGTSSELALACLDRPGRTAGRLLLAVTAFDALLEAAQLWGEHRAGLLADYARYWRGFGDRLGITVGSPALDPDLVGWVTDIIGRPDRRWDGPTATAGRAWWNRTTDELAELRTLSTSGQLTTTVPQIVANYAHTLHNRLGLTLSHEVMITDYLLAADRRAGRC